MGFLSIIFSLAGIYGYYSIAKKSDNFVEIDKVGITFRYGRMKPLTIIWDNITDVGYFTLVGRADSKWLGINLKDKTVVEEAYGQPKSNFSKFVLETSIDFTKNLSGYDTYITDFFDLKKIEPLIMKYWKNPKLRKKLSD